MMDSILLQLLSVQNIRHIGMARHILVTIYFLPRLTHLPLSVIEEAFFLIFSAIIAIQQWRIHINRQASAEQLKIFKLVAENAADMIALVDMNGRRIYNSPSYQRLLGYSGEELSGTRGYEQIHPDDLPKVKEAAVHAQTTGIGKTLEYRIRHKDGTWRVLESTANALRSPNGQVENLVIVNRDITERKAIQAKLEYDASHDSLTNLPNRSLFMDRLHHTAWSVKRKPGQTFAVMMLDVDGFRPMNDSFGDEFGNRLLIALGNRLKECLRRTDTVARSIVSIEPGEDFLARLGGDEFTILVESIQSPNDVLLVVERIGESLSEAFFIKGQKLFVSVSIGIALQSKDRDPADLVREAHIAMMRAKAMGRGKWQFFDPTMHAAVSGRVQMEMDLRRALEQEEFRLYFQPIVNLQTGVINGFEALLRWQPENMELVNPFRFIDVAEASGLILPIGRWVLREACRQLKVWQTSNPNLTITVNVSSKEFLQPNFVQAVKQILDENRLSAESVHLEITESMAMKDNVETSQLLEALHTLGVRLSIDDFGTGHSSLSRLSRFPFDTLKIDRSFVTGIERDEAKQAIVRLILTLAHTLSMRVIAEGAETIQEIGQLSDAGCVLIQGYFFSKPVDADRASLLLTNGFANAACTWGV